MMNMRFTGCTAHETHRNSQTHEGRWQEVERMKDFLIFLLCVDQNCSKECRVRALAHEPWVRQLTSVWRIDFHSLHRWLSNGHFHAGSKRIDNTINDMLLVINTKRRTKARFSGRDRRANTGKHTRATHTRSELREGCLRWEADCWTSFQILLLTGRLTVPCRSSSLRSLFAAEMIVRPL